MLSEQTSKIARLAWCCVVALAVFLIWLAIGATAHVGVAFLYAVPIALATWWFDWRVGSVFALLCAGLYVIDTTIEPVPHFGAALVLRLIVFVGALVTAAAMRRRVLGLEHSAEELEAIRMALTPPAMPRLPGADVAAAFIPSELGVSGDFYLLTNSPDGSTIAVVGDVVGHGPKAARLATFIRARLAMLAANSSDPAEILKLANAALLERPGREKELVSAVCLRFRAESRSIAWAIAGHPPPLLLPKLEPMGLAGQALLLGVEADFAPITAESHLGPEAGVLVYTDGATDLRLEEGSLLGIEGLRSLLAPLADMPAEPLVAEIEETLLEWAHGTIHDDICVLVLRPQD